MKIGLSSHVDDYDTYRKLRQVKSIVADESATCASIKLGLFCEECGAAKGSRTPMGLAETRRPPECKSGASTDFAIAALL